MPQDAARVVEQTVALPDEQSEPEGEDGAKAVKSGPTVERGARAGQEKGRRRGSNTPREKRPRGRPRVAEGHRKTSTGYMTSDGQKIVRLTLHLTPDQKRKLRIMTLEAGFENTSAYLIEFLDL